MRRGVVIALAILGLTACGQSQQGSETQGRQAQPGVNAGANQDATSCLDRVAAEKYGDAVNVCSAALNVDATNEKVKAALATAQAKVAEGAAQAAEGAADAAQDAADAAKQNVPKSY